jgi:AmmeMemoRadiSam system protein A
MVPSAIAPAPPVPELGAADFSRLLHLARQAVEATVDGRPCPWPDPGDLPPAILAPAAAFVTLHERGELRGCMGQLDWDRPMWANVMAAGAIVPREDPRFIPVSRSELPAIRLEVSVLGPPVELPGPADFDVRAHGIIVERSGRRALLLPQVAEELGWDAETTLDAVCRKAGLAGDAWRGDGTRLLAFRAVHASEPGFHG